MKIAALPRVCLALLKRDLVLAFRRRAEAINPLLFYLLVVTLFALGTGADARLLQRIGPGVLWVSALLATLLSLETIFRADFEDGTLEQLTIQAQPLWILVIVKVAAHWLITGLPLLLCTPLLAELLHVPNTALRVLMLTLLLGTPVLSLVGAIGVALTVGLRRGGIILSLLVLPWYVPVLIFAVAAVDAAGMGIPVAAHVSILAALLILALSLAPFATAAALKVSLS